MLRIPAEVERELEGGERLLWYGQPLQRVVFHQTDWLAIPFSVMWGGFSLFWEYQASGLSRGIPQWSFFTLWGIPFILIGQYMIWGRFLYTAWAKSRTYYVLTDGRVLVISTAWSRRTIESPLEQSNTVSFSERSGGIGTIDFTSGERFSPSLTKRQRVPIEIDLKTLRFHDILEARRVFALFKQARKEAKI